MIKVFLEPVADALVNCLEKWISWVPIGAEKLVGQWLSVSELGVSSSALRQSHYAIDHLFLPHKRTKLISHA